MDRKRKAAAGSNLMERGVVAVLLGGGFLLAPRFSGDASLLRPVALALRVPGWIALATGVALIALHQFIRLRARGSKPVAFPQLSVLPNSQDMFPPEIPPPPGGSSQMRASRTSGVIRFGTQPAAQSAWTRQVFADIEWRRFEAVCEHLFAQAGFEAKTQSHGADGGVDIWLYSRNAMGPAAVVQCKHWTKTVGVKEVREFFGVMASKGLKHGTFATSSSFTTAAVDFAKENGISPLDGEGLLALIARRTEKEQQDLLSVAYEGEYWRPTCASCGVKLIERQSGKDGKPFWGCQNFPRCRTTMNMRTA
jgi:restriction system protein